MTVEVALGGHACIIFVDFERNGKALAGIFKGPYLLQYLGIKIAVSTRLPVESVEMVPTPVTAPVTGCVLAT